MFEPTVVPSDAPPGLRTWIALMLRSVANALTAPEVTSIRFAILHEQPERYTDGDLVYADGTDWNPGSGAGLYERRGAAWRKL